MVIFLGMKAGMGAVWIVCVGGRNGASRGRRGLEDWLCVGEGGGWVSTGSMSSPWPKLTSRTCPFHRHIRTVKSILPIQWFSIFFGCRTFLRFCKQIIRLLASWPIQMKPPSTCRKALHQVRHSKNQRLGKETFKSSYLEPMSQKRAVMPSQQEYDTLFSQSADAALETSMAGWSLS